MQEQLRIIKKNAVEIISEDELVAKLKRSQKKKKPLRIKYGADPSAPDIHLGHTIALRKLRDFQELGHSVVFIIGDFTAQIGDPSGVSRMRPRLSPQQVRVNAATYEKQVFKILDKKVTEVVFNGSWCKKMRFADVIKLASHYTVARALERDDFLNRYRNGVPIGIHELLYPLIQAYDSVEFKADVELCGTDQKFNCLVARELQRDFKQEPEVIITLPLLEGTDGTRKMSKSFGNYIGIRERPGEIYGKVMSIPDKLIAKYFGLLTEVLPPKTPPREAKRALARELVSLYHSRASAAEAEEAFDRVFVRHEPPRTMPAVNVPSDAFKNDRVWIVRLLILAGFAKTGGEARRFIEQGGVSLDGRKCTDAGAELKIKEGMVLKVGKRRFARLITKEGERHAKKVD